MPVFFLFVGTVLLVATIRGKDQTDKLFALLKDDFTGTNNFFVWALAIGTVAAIGYVPALRKFSNLFLFLIFLGMVIRKKGPGGQNLLVSFYQQLGGVS